MHNNYLLFHFFAIFIFVSNRYYSIITIIYKKNEWFGHFVHLLVRIWLQQPNRKKTRALHETLKKSQIIMRKPVLVKVSFHLVYRCIVHHQKHQICLLYWFHPQNMNTNFHVMIDSKNLLNQTYSQASNYPSNQQFKVILNFSQCHGDRLNTQTSINIYHMVNQIYQKQPKDMRV